MPPPPNPNSRFPRRPGGPRPTSPDAPLRKETELEGILQGFTFQSDDQSYSVARFIVRGEEDPIYAVGNLLGATEGESLLLRGRWSQHPTYGQRFRVESLVPRPISTSAGLLDYLSRSPIKGVGPRTAQRIIRHFGDDALRILTDSPERMIEVPKVTHKQAVAIAEAWRRQRRIHELMVFLAEQGIPGGLAARLQRHYGDETAQVLRTNPYRAALEVRQVGFRTADRLASRMGIAPDSPQRAEAAIVHVLTEAAADGHTFLPESELVAQTVELLSIEDPALAREALARLIKSERVIPHTFRTPPQALRDPDATDCNAAFMPSLYTAEAGTAKLLLELVRRARKRVVRDFAHQLNEFEHQRDIELAPLQREAIRKTCEGGCLVVTGGPGTGKTTLVRAILEILKQDESVRVLLAAPTGRAAQRLAETTGRRATTIHRVLEYAPRMGFQRNPQRPLDADLLIVDESSMLDIPLAYWLLRAVKPGCSVLFVGDVDQLPSVGAGNFLRDLIESELVPVVRLDKIFRQASRSLIVENAHRINAGEFPILPGPDSPEQPRKGPPPDFFFVERDEPTSALDAIVRLVAERIPAKFNYNPIDDVQVLTPMRRGELGVERLNAALQERLNPGKTGLRRGDSQFRTGDKVMQLVNNYDLDVFNGDLGTLLRVDTSTQTVSVKFGARTVDYGPDVLDQLTLAYACTIHKSQGSEYKAVVIPIHSLHYVMLRRNLLYTAVTRGKRLVCLVGKKQSIFMALKNDEIGRRFSALQPWLRHGPPDPRGPEESLPLELPMLDDFEQS